MPFKVADNYVISLIKADNLYKFELLFGGTLVPVIGTIAKNIRFSDSSLKFEVDIRYPNMIMESGLYEFELKNDSKKNNYHELNIYRNGAIAFTSDINSSFEDDRIKVSFNFGNSIH